MYQKQNFTNFRLSRPYPKMVFLFHQGNNCFVSIYFFENKLHLQPFYIYLYRYVVQYINTEFVCKITILLYLLYFQPWCIVFYPWNKIDIFTGCIFKLWKHQNSYFQSMKITIATVTSRHVLHATSKIWNKIMLKTWGNVNLQKILYLLRCVWNLFHELFHSCLVNLYEYNQWRPYPINTCSV